MNQDKDIFVISDLHIGDGGPRDNFAVGDKENQLNLFLDFIHRENGELIITGDLFEFWQVSIGKVLTKWLKLINRFAAMDTTYVVGNHDIDLEALIGTDMLAHPLFKKMSRRFVREIGGKKFMFMHGHEADPYNKGDTPSWTRILTIFAGIVEDVNGSPLLGTGVTVEEALLNISVPLMKAWNWLVNLRYKKAIGGKSPSPSKRELTPSQNPERAQKLLDDYKKDKETELYDIAIVGHTHQVGRFEDWYFNSGCWVKEINNFLRISTDGQVRVFDWKDGQAIPNNTVLEPDL